MSVTAVYILVFFALLLFFFAFSRFMTLRTRRKADEEQRRASEGKRGDPGRCPLCNSLLAPGEKLVSTVFTGGRERDRRCNILGCPHCFPYAEKGAERLCPVCSKHVPPEGYLIGRLFNRRDTSHHVHIIGCTECHKHS